MRSQTLPIVATPARASRQSNPRRSTADFKQPFERRGAKKKNRSLFNDDGSYLCLCRFSFSFIVAFPSDTKPPSNTPHSPRKQPAYHSSSALHRQTFHLYSTPRSIQPPIKLCPKVRAVNHRLNPKGQAGVVGTMAVIEVVVARTK